MARTPPPPTDIDNPAPRHPGVRDPGVDQMSDKIAPPGPGVGKPPKPPIDPVPANAPPAQAPDGDDTAAIAAENQDLLPDRTTPRG